LLLFSAALLALTLAAYHPAWHGSMLWDDEGHLTKPALRSLHGLWRIWFEVGATQQYYPVTHTVFWLMQRVWGDDFVGYHVLNIVLHTSSAVLFSLILRRLAVPGAFFAALIFAVHPVGVESVAWMTELKNTLSGVFYLSAALMYLRFDADRRQVNYGLALGLFVLALLSKSVTATLPAATLVVFWWQRGRVRAREDVVPLLPFFALAIGAGLLTSWVERTEIIGPAGAAFHFTWVERCLIAGRAVCFYLGKLLWPAHFSFVYPRWDIDASAWWQYLYPLAVVLFVTVLWLGRARSRAPLAAVLLFIGTLVPALGFVNVYPFLFSFVADHFQYLAGLGIIALVSSGIAVLVARAPGRPVFNAAVAALIVGTPLTAATWHESAAFSDAETLYRTTISRNPSAWMAHNNLGRLLLTSSRARADDQASTAPAPERQRLLDEAASEFRTTLQIKPDLPQAHNNLGSVLLDLGRLDEAKVEFEEALRLKPGDDEVHNNLAMLLEKMGRHDEAIAQSREALRLRPGDAASAASLGDALQSEGRLEEAITAYRTALRLNPGDAEVHHNLGTALGRIGRPEEAIKEFLETLRLNPQSVIANRSLGIALMRTGKFDDAVVRFRSAVALAPQSGPAHYSLADALEAAGRREEAVAEYREAVKHQPNFPEAFNGLGVASAELGRYTEAAAAFREALRLKPDFADAAANLARALSMIKGTPVVDPRFGGGLR
jgi:tetratricopeptide (TPR) repeat protein